MKSTDEKTKEARNEDPITGEPGSHPVGVGVGTAAGATTGAAIGAVGGPVGAVAGAVVGGIAGAVTGKSVAERIDPTVEDTYWRDNHAAQPYAKEDSLYDDYAPAYRVGYTGPERYGSNFESAEEALRNDWDTNRGTSRLSWEEARPAARASWERAEKRISPGGPGARIGV